LKDQINGVAYAERILMKRKIDGTKASHNFTSYGRKNICQ